MPPVVFAVCTDQTVAVIRRHGLGIAEDSAWTVLGRLVLAAVQARRVILLYGLRFVLAPAETATGLRRMVLDAAPLPGAAAGPPGPGGAPRDRTVPRCSRDRSRGDPAAGPGGRPRIRRPRERPPVTPGKQPGPVTPERLAEFYAADLASGRVPPSGRSSVTGRSATTPPATCTTTWRRRWPRT